MKKNIFSGLAIIFSLMSISNLMAQSKPDYPFSVGVDMFGVFRKSLEITTQYRPVDYFGISLITGNQFSTDLDSVYKVNSKNSSVSGYYLKLGPRFVINNSSGRDVYFVGIDFVYSHYIHKGDASIGNYYGTYDQSMDQEGDVFGYSITNGATIHFSDRLAMDLGCRLNSFSLKNAVDPIIKNYPQPGFGSIGSPADNTSNRAFVFALFSNIRVYF